MAAIADLAPVIPVLTIERVEDAVPLARALVKGGLPVLEITLRTAAAVAAIEAIASQVPDAVVGAGTVLEASQVEQIQRAGARFAVSPGCTPALAVATRLVGLPFLPGVQTLSEAMALAEQTGSLPPPKHIINAPTQMMRDMGFKDGYKFDHDFPYAFSGQEFMPDALAGHRRPEIYAPNERGNEREVKKRMDFWENIRADIRNGKEPPAPEKR